MVSADDIEELKGLAMRSCMASATGDAHSLGKMLGWSKSQGKHLRAGMHQRVRAVVDAVFDGDAEALLASKDALLKEVKRVQPRPEEGMSVYHDDGVIQGLIDEIAHNVTRFTKHLQKMRDASTITAETAQPGTVIDSASALTEKRRSNLFGPGHPHIPPPTSLRRAG